MGSLLFDFLTESFLFEAGHLEDDFATIPETQLASELNRYREYSLQNLAALKNEATASSSILRVFAGVARLPVRTLMQSALYVEQYVLEDPLFSFTSKEPAGGDAMRSFIGAPENRVNRRELANGVRYLRDLTPMVAANYVKFLPVSYLFEPPAQLPVRYSENYFDDVLPTELLDLYRGRAIVKRIEKAGEGWRIRDDLPICRSISIEFESHDSGQSYIQFLFEQEILSVDEKTRTFTFRQYLPDQLPHEQLFNAWVRQSVNSAAKDSYHRLATELALAGDLTASYFSTSQLNFDVLEHLGQTSSEQCDLTASTLMKLELPFLDNIDMETLMAVRKNEGDAFQTFRYELDKQLAELRLETDPERFKVKAQKLVFDLSKSQPAYLRMKAKELQRGALSQSIMHSAVLAGSMWAMNLTPFAPLAVAGGVAKAIFDYRAAIRPSTAYFLWKVLKN